MAISNVALFGGAFLTPVFAGKISASMSWQWTFFLVAIFTGAALPLTFFLVPETAFRRPDYLNTDFRGDSDRDNSQCPTDNDDDDNNNSHLSMHCPGTSGDHESRTIEKEARSGADESPGEQDNGEVERVVPTRESYLQSLRLFNGRKTDENFFKLLLRPFPLFFHPGILWVSKTYSYQGSV